MIKAIIFDFNGTMIFDSEFHRRVWFEFIPRHTGRRVTYEEIDKNMLGRDNASILRKYFGEHLSDREIGELTQEKEAAYRRLCLANKERFKLVDGVVEFLDYLKETGMPTTIATGSEISNLKFYYEHFELWRWFDFDRIVYDDGSFPGKPAPDIYLRAAAALKADPADCLVFEDAHSGVLAAHNAGIGYIVAVSETEDASLFDSAGGVDLVTKNFLGFTRFLELKP
ncbi:MAG: HAD family hydrolase [Eubacteriales bacterium]|jgi:HAD superfamily hydrolase (TIGR01509 family)